MLSCKGLRSIKETTDNHVCQFTVLNPITGGPFVALTASLLIWVCALQEEEAWLLVPSTLFVLLTTVYILLDTAEERLHVLGNVGILLTRRCRSGLVFSRYIDLLSVDTVIINEGITSTDVKVYLTFLLQGSQETAVAFEHVLPPFKILLPIYQHLYETIQQAKDNSSGGFVVAPS